MPTWLAIALIVMLVGSTAGLSVWLATRATRAQLARVLAEQRAAEERAQRARERVTKAADVLATTTAGIPGEVEHAIATASDADLRAAALRILRGDGDG